MKTKWKEKEKKEEKKRSEEKKVLPRFELGPFGAPGESFTTRPRGTHSEIRRNFIIIKSLRALLNVNSKIFFRRITAVSTVNPDVDAFHRIYM